MLRSVKALKGSTIRALDGDLGTVDDFFFDDEQWTVRYLVVDTGGWLLGRKVLISPIALDRSDWDQQLLYVHLTREQVEKSPGVETDKPVSRQWEAGYHNYYGWPYYWGGIGFWGPLWYPGGLAAQPDGGAETWRQEVAARARDDADEHLRSTREVTGYGLHASDGDLGHVEDFILDDRSWAIRYMAADTTDWWTGKKFLLPPEWIDHVSWPGRSVTVELSREQIKNAPEWDPGVMIDRDYEERLCQYYCRDGYWERERLQSQAA